MLTSEELEAIRGRAEAADKGPWTACDYASGHEWQGMYVDSDTTRDTMRSTASSVSPADATFIAHARTDVPKLLAEVERLQAILQDVVTRGPIAIDDIEDTP